MIENKALETIETVHGWGVRFTTPFSEQQTDFLRIWGEHNGVAVRPNYRVAFVDTKEDATFFLLGFA